jgi:hypothetical protein
MCLLEGRRLLPVSRAAARPPPQHLKPPAHQARKQHQLAENQYARQGVVFLLSATAWYRASMNACLLSLPVRPQHIFNFARHEDDQIFLDPGSFLESAEQWLINGSYLRRRLPYIPRQPFDGPFVQPLLKFVFVQKKVFHGHTILSERVYQ